MNLHDALPLGEKHPTCAITFFATLQQIQAQFQREPDSLQTGKSASAKLRIVYGASGNFVSQVLQGAPIALLLAADEQSIERLHAAGRSEDQPLGVPVTWIGRCVEEPDLWRIDQFGALAPLAATGYEH